jgi:hypothetical protein
MRDGRLTVVRAYKVTQGAVLRQSLTSSWTDGDRVAVEAATDFSPAGGDGVFEPEDNPESFSYSGIEISSSDDPAALDYLTGVVRSNPVAHARGTFVQEGSTATFEKQVDGYPNGGDTLVTGIPVRQNVYSLVRLRDYTGSEMPVVPVVIEDDGRWYVTDGPVGTAPFFDEDLEVLPPVGGGDASASTTDPSTGKILPPKGMGYEDGSPPSTGVAPVVVGGIGTLFIRFDTIANNSQVTYKAHVHTADGFTPSDSTQVGTIELAGTPGFTAVVPVKDFPAGHVLDGTTSDPPKAGTTYYAVVVPSDGSGDFAGPYTQGSGSPIQVATADIIAGSISAELIAAGAITSTKIQDGAIETPKLAAGAVTAVKITANAITANEIATGAITSDEIAANTITGGDIAGTTITGTNIAGTTITADKLSVSSLSAITANLGTITAGSISSVSITSSTITSTTITSANIYSGESGTARIGIGPIAGQNQDTITFYDSGGTARAQIGRDVNDLDIGSATGDINLLPGSTGTVYLWGEVLINEAARVAAALKAEKLVVGTASAAPDTGYVAIYKDGNDLKAKDASGTVRTLCTF